MTERVATNHEQARQPEVLRSPEKQHTLSPEASQESEKSSSERLAQDARETINQATEHDQNPLKRYVAAENAQAVPQQPQTINRELKAITLRRELKELRRTLPAPQRVLSKVIHQPAIRVVSEAAGKSVSRPSGLFGGGLVAFLGSSAYLYLAKHLGFRYNYFLFFVLFVGGFVLGLLLELLVWVLSSRHRHIDS